MDEVTSVATPRLHAAAVASVVLGMASFGLCLLGLTGVPALYLGWRGLRAVNSSEGQYSGARLAIAGMILGGLATLATLFGVVAILIINLQQTSARITCQDNLRRLGASLNSYADTHKRFPAAVAGPRELPPEKQLSWMSEMFASAEVDRTKAWDEPANAAALNRPVRVFLCPATPGYDPNHRPALTSYVGLAGIGPDAASLKREEARAGMFGYDRGAKRDEFEGGLSLTIAVLETGYERGPWLAGGFPTVRDLSPDADTYSGPGKPFGGLHLGMMNVLFADGSVRPMNDNTSGRVLRQQATLRR